MNITPELTTLITTFAASYDCNAYGAGSYDHQDCVTATTPATGTQAGGSAGLAATGEGVVIYALIGAVLIIAAAVTLLSLKRKSKKATQ